MLIRPETATVLVATCHDATRRTGGTPRLLTTEFKSTRKFSVRFQQMRTYSRGGNPRRICYSEISGLPTWALARSDTRRRSSFRAIASLLGSKNSSAVLAIFWPGIDIDIPTKPNNSKCMPQSVKEAVLAAFRARRARRALISQVLRDAARQPQRRGKRFASCDYLVEKGGLSRANSLSSALRKILRLKQSFLFDV